MNLERYEYSVNHRLLSFEFYSEGPNGRIKKVIQFTPVNVDGTTYFHIAFGDLNSDDKTLDDLVISNNGDRNKILATVAHVILDFTEEFPDMMVFARGSTPARTRLYQMGLTNNWLEVEKLLTVLGYANDQWEPFQKDVHYEALMIIRKK